MILKVVVTMFVYPIAHNRRLCQKGFSLSLLVEERIANIGIPLDVFGFLQFWWFLRFEFVQVFGSLQTSLMLIVGESAGGGYVAVAVGVSNRWQVTGDRWQETRNTWHLTHYMWHLTPATWHHFLFYFIFYFIFFGFVLVVMQILDQ